MLQVGFRSLEKGCLPAALDEGGGDGDAAVAGDGPCKRGAPAGAAAVAAEGNWRSIQNEGFAFQQECTG